MDIECFSERAESAWSICDGSVCNTACEFSGRAGCCCQLISPVFEKKKSTINQCPYMDARESNWASVSKHLTYHRESKPLHLHKEKFSRAPFWSSL